MIQNEPMRMRVESHGTVCLLAPLDDAAHAWLRENTAEPRAWQGRNLACEPRYVADILAGFQADGGTLTS